MTSLPNLAGSHSEADGGNLAHPRPWPVYDPQAIEVCNRLLAEGRSYDYGRGEEIATFEDTVATAHDRKFALAVNSGTSALLLAYLALGVEPGDEVLVPTFTFVGTATPLFLLGASPVLVDSGDDTGNVTAAALDAAMTDRTVGVTVTHLFGHSCDMGPIVAMARRRGVFVVEDCSHAHGSSENGRSVGTHGDVAIYSMGSRKMVSGGMGGMLLTDDDRIFDIACLASASKQRSLASVSDPELRRLADVGLGGNLRMSPLAAVLGTSLFIRLGELVAQKSANSEALISGLSALPGIRPTERRPGCDLGARFGVHIDYDSDVAGLCRSDLLARLQLRGAKVAGPQAEPMHRATLFTERSHGLPIPRVPASVSCGAPSGYPVADRLADRWISLPADYLHGDASELVWGYIEAFTEVLAG